MAGSLSKDALDQLFLSARTQNKWLARDVPDSLLRELFDLMRMGPTSANCQPARLLFLKSGAAKERLKPHLSANNQEKTLSAPVVAIIGYDLAFYDHLPRMFPHNQDARSWFATSEEVARTTAFRNGTLQGAYLMLAARSLGLDCGPMSGFNNAGVDQEFFPDGKVKSNFICNLGYGDPAGLFARSPRFAFDEIAKIL